MVRVHVLTPGPTSQNGQAFLYPLVVHQRALARRGFDVRLFNSEKGRAALCDCDVLILDSKFFSDRWRSESDAVEARIADLSRSVPRLLYFDITDSATWDHARALPYVTAYVKNQLLRDRRHYLRPLYGYRLYTDFYHQADDVHDEDEAWSEPVSNPALLDKLQVGWNSALMDYSLMGPLRLSLFRRLGWGALLRPPRTWAKPDAARPVDLSCRFAADHRRRTVAHQRRGIRDALAGRTPAERLSRRRYLAELTRSKIVVSPFGYGEICYRDYEAFRAGALLLKPDMSHLETWPDLYRDGETMATHRWDLDDLEERVDALLTNRAQRLAIAREGQAAYRRHLDDDAACGLFVERFAEVVEARPERSHPAQATA